MSQQGTSLDGALQTITAMGEERLENFLATRKDILQRENGVPSWGAKVDRDIDRFIDGVGTLAILARGYPGTMLTMSSRSMGQRCQRLVF